MMVFQILIYLMLLLISILMLMLVMPCILWFFGYKGRCFNSRGRGFGPLKWIHLVFRMRDMTTNELNLKFLGIPIRIMDKKKHPHEEKTKKDVKSIKTYKKRPKVSKELLMQIADLFTETLKHIRPRRLEIKGRYGFIDPYHTESHVPG